MEIAKPPASLALLRHVDNLCRRGWCVWELRNLTRNQERWHHCWSLPHYGNLRPFSCVLSVSVYSAYEKMLENRCVLLGVLPGTKARLDDEIGFISCQAYRNVRYRVGVVPVLLKCPLPVSVL